MKYCISGRQPKSVLRQADEIKMQYRDRDRLINYVEEFPDKTFILEVPKGAEECNWDLWKAFGEKVDFMLALSDLSLAAECNKQGIKFYWAFPCFSWYELDSIIKLNPCYIKLTAPLSFDLIKVRKKTSIPLRLCANIAHDGYIPRENGIFGTFVRPEDVSIYETWIAALEFETEELSQEATLLKIYKEDKQWLGNLNLLITNLNFNVDNRALPDELAMTRSNCGQRCMESGRCHFCLTAFKFADTLRKEHYRRLKGEVNG